MLIAGLNLLMQFAPENSELKYVHDLSSQVTVNILIIAIDIMHENRPDSFCLKEGLFF